MSGTMDPEILQGFAAEIQGYLPQIAASLERAQRQPGNPQALHEARRCFHTVKGASALLGLHELSLLGHHAEEALDRVRAAHHVLAPETASLLARGLELLADCAVTLGHGSLDVPPSLPALNAELRLHLGLAEESALPMPPSFEELDAPEAPSLPWPEEPSSPGPAPGLELVSEELMQSFLAEAEEHLTSVARGLDALEQTSEPRPLLEEIRRSIHTLKGAAAIVGLRRTAELAHRAEDLLDRLYDGTLSLSPQARELLLAAADGLMDLVADEVQDAHLLDEQLPALHARLEAFLIQGAAAPAAPPLSAAAGSLAAPPLSAAAGSLAAPPVQAPSAQPAAGVPAGAGLRPEPGPRSEPPPREGAPPAPAQGLRVPLDRVDGIINLLSELVINGSTLEQHFAAHAARVEDLGSGVERLRRAVGRLETQLLQRRDGLHPRPAAAGAAEPGFAAPRGEFDDLEMDRYNEAYLLSRELAETCADLGALSGELQDLVGDFDVSFGRHQRLTGEFQDKILSLRMVPLANLVTRLQRAVRVTAHQCRKQVELVVEGERVELDKTVLDRMADPLLHVLRNAVDHGIEDPEVRAARGKPRSGRILVKAYHSGTQVVLQVSDDGAGLDGQALRRAAVARGILQPAEAEALPEEELWPLIFRPGFSTAAEVDEVSGRGVGMDVVKTTVDQLRGVLSFHSMPGEGTRLTIRLPMTMAIVRVLLVKAHQERFAVPMGAVQQILRIERDEVLRVAGDPVLRAGNEVLPLLRLSEVLHLEPSPQELPRRCPVLVVDVGERRYALLVDELIEAREVVAKPLGQHLRRVSGIVGATVLGDGSVVLIVNPSELSAAPSRAAAPRRGAAQPVGPEHHTLDVLVVDDSFSVRRVLAGVLRKAGWNPIEAKDGLDALEQLQQMLRLPDVLLLDIEMPRMDGYELTATLRARPETQHLPIVMLTSRAGEKHRQKAFASGCTDYLVKPFQDELLLQTLRKHTSPSRGPRAS